MRGLTFFKRTSGRGVWNLVSYHSWHSMTWSWLISFSLRGRSEAVIRPLYWSHRSEKAYRCGIRIPYIGTLRWARQEPMWYRDLYYKQKSVSVPSPAEPDRKIIPIRPDLVRVPSNLIENGKN